MNGPSRLAKLTVLLGLALSAACEDGPSDPNKSNSDAPNLRIETLYIVQSTQTRDGRVPLVAGKDGYVRVFAVADRANSATPSVRVRLYQGGAVVETYTIPADGPSVPLSVDPSSLANSWDVKVPGALIQPGLQIVAEVDPSNAVAESNDKDNAFPTDGTPATLTVEALRPFRMRFVPMVQAENGRTGRITEANKEQYLVLARKIFPLSSIDSDIRAPYTVRGLGFDPQGNTWVAAVSELDAVRVAEGSDRFYYGVVQTDYPGGGVVGIAAGIPAKTALGWDRFPDANPTLAHEIGHDWGRRHAPCGGAAGADPNYPYVQGMIGVFGMDVETAEVKVPTANTDIMGYCNANFWISDYNYTAIFNYRRANPSASRAPTRALLVWGRIENGEPVLEPAFELTTRPSLPTSRGPYGVQGLDAAGRVVFSLGFGAEPMQDVPGDSRHFAFAIPMDAEGIEKLASIRLTAGGRTAERRSDRADQALDDRDAVAAPTRVAAAPSGQGEITLRWDRSAYPMVMVRDSRTGEILALAREGSAEVAGASGPLDLVFSDGVRSFVQRIR